MLLIRTCSSASELEGILSKINVNKAPGVDNLPARILRTCAKEISIALAHLFNLSSCVPSRNPKRDFGGIKYQRFARNTLSETKIQNLQPYARRRASPSVCLFHLGIPSRGEGGSSDGSIDTSSARRSGIVAFYIAHSIIVQINGEQYQHVFAVVQWYQFDENQDYFGKPVQLWKINNYASCGPALFMPVQKIAQKLRVNPPLKLQGLASLCYNCFIDSCNIRGAVGCYHFALFN